MAPFTFLVNLFGGAWTKITAIATAIAAAALALAAAYFRIRRDAIKDMEAEQTRARFEAIQKRKALEDETKALPTPDLDADVGRWTRRSDRMRE